MLKQKNKENKKSDKSKEKKDKSIQPEKAKKTFALLRGMHDILPREEKYWKMLYHAA